MSVATYPGTMALTLTPRGAHSLARARVRPGEAGLGGGVAGNVDAALETQQGGGEDDFAVAAVDHGPSDLAGEDELAGEIDLQDAVPVAVGVLGCGRPCDYAGVVDQDVDWTRPGGELSRQVGDCCPVG